jgi:chemotaxis family two-component system sensor kinase Cph1
MSTDPPESSSQQAWPLTTCDREPIHIPSLIQPHGYLLAVDEQDRKIAMLSANCDTLFDAAPQQLLGKRLYELFAPDLAARLSRELSNHRLSTDALLLAPTESIGARTFDIIAHRIDGLIVVELEPADRERQASFAGLYPFVQEALSKLRTAATPNALSELAAAEVREITGFDRVLIYRFDADGHGTVTAESGNGVLPSYLGLRFPASDIPRQARELYQRNRQRLIVDAEYRPVPLVPSANPLTARPLDMSYCLLRSVSPVHVEYMKNMRTPASMSLSIMRGQELWGLISCHHHEARSASFEVRTACDLIAQVLSIQLLAAEQIQEHEFRAHLRTINTRLLAFMAAEESFVAALVRHPAELLELLSACGTAIVIDGTPQLIGTTPSAEQVRDIVAWLDEHVHEETFATDSLVGSIPAAADYKNRACGLLAISISKRQPNYLLWFRPELVTTVHWAGDPRKTGEVTGAGLRLDPRKSFESWQEIVALRSKPWLKWELATASELRNAIVGIVLRKAEDLAELAEELRRSNKELEAFSYSVSHDLRAPFRHIVGYAELLKETGGTDEKSRRYINTIVESAQYAGKLVDNLLSFSHMARASLASDKVDMEALFKATIEEFRDETAARNIHWHLGKLPWVYGDGSMLRLVARNLLSNAVKYTGRRSEAQISIACSSQTATESDRDGVEQVEYVFSVRDDGVGFDMQYHDKLFGVFQRLHRIEEYEGTGIGLANVKRIIERHGGRVWAEGKVDQGATFFFTLPQRQQGEHHG